MTLEKILAIAGKPGLYLLKIQTRTGFVAESLLDGKRITVGLRSNVSLLSEISIYTHSDDRPLTDVMRAIAVKENEGPAMSGKEDNDKLAAYFTEVLPDYDADRVYVSDIKKVLNWYNLLQAKGMVSKETPVAAETPAAESSKETDVDAVKTAEAKPKKEKAAAADAKPSKPADKKEVKAETAKAKTPKSK